MYLFREGGGGWGHNFKLGRSIQRWYASTHYIVHQAIWSYIEAEW